MNKSPKSPKLEPHIDNIVELEADPDNKMTQEQKAALFGAHRETYRAFINRPDVAVKISARVKETIMARLGEVDKANYKDACSNNIRNSVRVSARQLLYKRYGLIIDKHEGTNTNVNVNFDGIDDRDLIDACRADGIDIPPEIEARITNRPLNGTVQN